MLTEEQLIQVVESSIFLPILPGRFEALDIPGVQGRYAKGVSGGFINRVGGSRLSSGQIHRTIEAVMDHFNALNQKFMWFVASSDTPNDLQQQLQEAGFSPSWIMSGMVLTDLSQDFPTSLGVRVTRARPNERDLVSRIYQDGFPLGKTNSDLFADMIDIPSLAHYLVYLENVDEPIGVTSMFYIPHYEAVILEASAILEPFRGQGIYKNLITQRIHDARADGMKVAVVQANEATSAPALRKIGFVKKSDIRLWSPPETESTEA
jgi:GNAT superfamily N-acetyltransferase